MFDENHYCFLMAHEIPQQFGSTFLIKYVVCMEASKIRYNQLHPILMC